jgi:hypothetical protein
MNQLPSVLFCVVVLLGCGGSESKGGEKNVNLKQVDYRISVDSAYEQLNKNQPKFYHTYGHKVVQITGRIGQIKRDNIQVIGTKNTFGGFYYVKCSYSEFQKNLVFDLKVGQPITVTGYLDPTKYEKYQFLQPDLNPCNISE